MGRPLELFKLRIERSAQRAATLVVNLLKPEGQKRTAVQQTARPEDAGVVLGLLHRPTIICLLLAALTLAAFLPAVNFDFVGADDSGYFSANPIVLAGLRWQGVKWSLHTHDLQSPYPVTWLSLMLDAQLFGSGPAGPHLTNILLHAANSAFLFLLLRRLKISYWCSVFAAALFAVHPLHVESVAWISERKGLLSGFFFLLSIFLYAGYVDKIRPANDGTKQQRPKALLASTFWYGATLASFFLGLMSKPVLVVLPCMLLLLDFWPFNRVRKSVPLRIPTIGPVIWLALEKLPFFLVAARASLTQVNLARAGGALTPLVALPLGARIGNALVSYSRYLGKVFWPLNLAFPYPHPGRWPVNEVLICAGLVGGVTFVALSQGRQRPWAITTWLWFVGSLTPVIGIVQWGNQAMADRFAYIPIVGVFLLISLGVAEAAQKWRVPNAVVAAGGLLLLVACGVRSRDQLQYWRTGETLARRAIAVTQNNADAYDTLGSYYYRRGRFDEAEESFRAAINITPHSSSAHNNLGLTLAAQGRLRDALSEYDSALQCFPNYAEAQVNAGSALAAQGGLDEAAERYRKALLLRPHFVPALFNLGAVLARAGKLEDAIDCYRQALAVNSADARVQAGLGEVLNTKGEFEAALTCFDAALRLQPTYAKAWVGRGNVFAACNKPHEALQDYSQALRLEPSNWQTHLKVAAELATVQSLGEAVDECKTALKLNETAEGHVLLGKILKQQGNLAGAEQEFAAARRLAPRQSPASDGAGGH